jgi:uncharacterized protein (DUF779 family)
VGVIAVGTGLAFYVIAQDRYDETIHNTTDCKQASPPMCYPSGLTKIADAQSLANTGTVTWIVGGIAAVAGGAVWYFAPRDQVTVTPVANAHGAGLAIGGSF